MDYIGVKKAVEKWGLTPRMIDYYCNNGRIKGAQMVAIVWLIPLDAARPEDRCKGNGRKRVLGNTKKEG